MGSGATERGAAAAVRSMLDGGNDFLLVARNSVVGNVKEALAPTPDFQGSPAAEIVSGSGRTADAGTDSLLCHFTHGRSKEREGGREGGREGNSLTN